LIRQENSEIVSHPFPQDEYQACSGEASVVEKKALTKGENAAGAKARIYFMAFTARLKSCPFKT
jgi:hypothetical protein